MVAELNFTLQISPKKSIGDKPGLWERPVNITYFKYQFLIKKFKNYLYRVVVIAPWCLDLWEPGTLAQTWEAV